MAHLDANSGGLHALDMISLCTNMAQYYVQADGIPQFIVMMEDAQKKAKRAGMPIADVELVMMALAAVLAAARWMIGKVSWPSTVPGGRGRSHAVSPTSNASANSKPLGEVNHFAVLTLSFPPPPPQLTG